METCKLVSICAGAETYCDECSKQNRKNMFKEKHPIVRYAVLNLENGNLEYIGNTLDWLKYMDEDRCYNLTTKVIKLIEEEEE